MADKNFVRSMFNNIAPTYDKLNHILSLNIDKIWRKKAVKRICKNLSNSEAHVLDVACGTADSSIALAKAGIPFVTGVDISEGMIKVGEEKIKSLNLNNINLKVEDCENLSFEDNSFDSAFIAFGIRNFEDKKKGDDYKPPRRNSKSKKLSSQPADDENKLSPKSSDVAC